MIHMMGYKQLPFGPFKWTVYLPQIRQQMLIEPVFNSRFIDKSTLNIHHLYSFHKLQQIT